MKIEWNIIKKKGNYRPSLHYSFVVEDFERDLALPPIRIQSTIHEPMEVFEEHCYPNKYERAQTPEYKGFYDLEIVSHKGRLWPQEIRLSWREDNLYPEIEESFKMLRQAFEEELAKANNSKEINISSSLDITEQAHLEIAPSILAEKFLDFAKGKKAV